jgi:hypothetical protein
LREEVAGADRRAVSKLNPAGPPPTQTTSYISGVVENKVPVAYNLLCRRNWRLQSWQIYLLSCRARGPCVDAFIVKVV